MDPPSRFRHGNPLDAVDAALELELAVRVLPRHEKYDFLVAAHLGRARAQRLHLPFVPLREEPVHPREIRREERRLVPARSGADLEHRVAGVVGVAGKEEHLDPLLRLLELALDLDELGARELDELAVPSLAHDAGGLLPAPLEIPEAPDRADGLLEIAALAGELAVEGLVADVLWLRELLGELLEAPDHVFVAVARRHGRSVLTRRAGAPPANDCSE